MPASAPRAHSEACLRQSRAPTFRAADDHFPVLEAASSERAFEAEHQPRSRDGRHLHASHLCEILPRLKNEHVVLLHVSRRTGVGKAKKCLRKLLGGEIPANVQFLMDLRDARHAGDAAAAAGEPPVD